MIYITGDTHGEQERFSIIERECSITKGDYLVVCGDFGYVFQNNDSEKRFLDNLERKEYTILFVDGNHENFTAIFNYPEEQLFGGRVHKIRNNVFHLMRGQVFTIEGKTFFTLGGAYSIDRYMRRLGVSYWDEELASPSDFKESTRSLKVNDMNVDYILTHTAPREMIRRLGYSPEPEDMELTGFLEWIMYEVQYKHWFCGHWHEDKEFAKERFSFLWFGIKMIE